MGRWVEPAGVGISLAPGTCFTPRVRCEIRICYGVHPITQRHVFHPSSATFTDDLNRFATSFAFQRFFLVRYPRGGTVVGSTPSVTSEERRDLADSDRS